MVADCGLQQDAGLVISAEKNLGLPGIESTMSMHRGIKAIITNGFPPLLSPVMSDSLLPHVGVKNARQLAVSGGLTAVSQEIVPSLVMVGSLDRDLLSVVVATIDDSGAMVEFVGLEDLSFQMEFLYGLSEGLFWVRDAIPALSHLRSLEEQRPFATLSMYGVPSMLAREVAEVQALLSVINGGVMFGG
ncbi:hypothetical protein NE237_029349 [Protea cynaroides]|uniref:Uncharacterized protein n=1 Tax=Protea cynaroides TaxID=273540 RepID=A0A9Q0JV00_9MAGN|nr:hypothetical protein NE237_029349 [Protea cynaroides]